MLSPVRLSDTLSVCLSALILWLSARSRVLGSMWAGGLSYSAVKLFSKYSNLCDHGTWTSRTDGQTEDILILWHNRALRSIARQKRKRRSGPIGSNPFHHKSVATGVNLHCPLIFLYKINMWICWKLRGYTQLTGKYKPVFFHSNVRTDLETMRPTLHTGSRSSPVLLRIINNYTSMKSIDSPVIGLTVVEFVDHHLPQKSKSSI